MGVPAVDSGVELGKRAVVGPYDIQPVRALGRNALTALNRWLGTNGFPTEAPEHMKYFVDNKIEGSIINLGSMTALCPLSRVFTYCISKAAVHNLSKNLAREWAPNGIRVNTLVPGFFPAEQNRKIIDEDRKNSILTGTPMDRFGEAHELIGATLLLASETAGGFITGHEMIVDGGYSAMTI